LARARKLAADAAGAQEARNKAAEILAEAGDDLREWFTETLLTLD
jgi:hypothetical protein